VPREPAALGTVAVQGGVSSDAAFNAVGFSDLAISFTLAAACANNLCSFG
jgi:hypothetical protein